MTQLRTVFTRTVKTGSGIVCPNPQAADRLFFLGLVAISIFFAAGSALADEQRPAKPLQGGVVEVQVTLNDLRDARLSISRVRKATANLYDEVTRQQVTMSYNPNLVGTSVIMTPTASFSGPVLPARKKWVDASMAEIGPIIALFKEDVDHAIESDRHTNVSASARKSLDPLRNDAFSAVKKSNETYKALEKATKGPGYDNASIASMTKTLDNQMKQLDKSLKRAISILQKEEKSSRKRA